MKTGSEPISAELLEKSEMPNLVIIGITSAAMILLVLNAALVAWFVTRKQNKGKENTYHSELNSLSPTSVGNICRLYIRLNEIQNDNDIFKLSCRK